MCRLRKKALDWEARARAIVRGKSALKRLRDLLQAGLRLGVDMPWLDILRSHICAREWREAANKVGPAA